MFFARMQHNTLIIAITTVVSKYMVEKGIDVPEMKNIKNGGMDLNVKCMIQIVAYCRYT